MGPGLKTTTSMCGNSVSSFRGLRDLSRDRTVQATLRRQRFIHYELCQKSVSAHFPLEAKRSGGVQYNPLLKIRPPIFNYICTKSKNTNTIILHLCLSEIKTGRLKKSEIRLNV